MSLWVKTLSRLALKLLRRPGTKSFMVLTVARACGTNMSLDFFLHHSCHQIEKLHSFRCQK